MNERKLQLMCSFIY